MKEFTIPNIFTIETNFDPSHEDKRKITYSRDDEVYHLEFTEALRNLAEMAVNPIDLPDLKIKVVVIFYNFHSIIKYYFTATESARI